MSKGIIFMGHGSHREDANEEIREIAQMVEREMGSNIQCETAFLSIASPDLPEAVSMLNQAGVKKIIICPIFLVTGNHISNDIPALIEKMKVDYPQVDLVMARHIGADPLVADILKRRIGEVSV